MVAHVWMVVAARGWMDGGGTRMDGGSGTQMDGSGMLIQMVVATSGQMVVLKSQ